MNEFIFWIMLVSFGGNTIDTVILPTHYETSEQCKNAADSMIGKEGYNLPRWVCIPGGGDKNDLTFLGIPIK